MTFCTAINCMDGRVQMPVIDYLQRRFDAVYVDTVTEPGPIRILADQNPAELVQSIVDRLKISIEKHQSVGIAVVGHHDCAGNPSPKEVQTEQVAKSIQFLRPHVGNTPIIGLWVDDNWDVHEVSSDAAGE